MAGWVNELYVPLLLFFLVKKVLEAKTRF